MSRSEKSSHISSAAQRLSSSTLEADISATMAGATRTTSSGRLRQPWPQKAAALSTTEVIITMAGFSSRPRARQQDLGCGGRAQQTASKHSPSYCTFLHSYVTVSYTPEREGSARVGWRQSQHTIDPPIGRGKCRRRRRPSRQPTGRPRMSKIGTFSMCVSKPAEISPCRALPAHAPCNTLLLAKAECVGRIVC